MTGVIAEHLFREAAKKSDNAPTAADNMTNALQTDAEWWASHHVELTEEKFEAWLAKGGRGLSGSAR